MPIYGVYDFTNRNDTMPPQFLPWILEPLVMKEFLADEPEAFAKASPLDNIHADAPPFFVVHGDNDTLAPVQDARAFVEEPGRDVERPGRSTSSCTAPSTRSTCSARCAPGA